MIAENEVRTVEIREVTNPFVQVCGSISLIGPAPLSFARTFCPS